MMALAIVIRVGVQSGFGVKVGFCINVGFGVGAGFGVGISRCWKIGFSPSRSGNRRKAEGCRAEIPRNQRSPFRFT